MSLSKAPPLNDTEFSAAFRDQATDEDIEAVLRHLIFWSYAMRDPFGRVCAVGRGTRSECIENSFRLAVITPSRISHLLRTPSTKPAPSMVLGDSSSGHLSSTQIRRSGRHRQMCSGPAVSFWPHAGVDPARVTFSVAQGDRSTTHVVTLGGVMHERSPLAWQSARTRH